jgi:hypothetical protein
MNARAEGNVFYAIASEIISRKPRKFFKQEKRKDENQRKFNRPK